MKLALQPKCWLLCLLLTAACASDCNTGCGSGSEVLATVSGVSGGVLQLDDYAPPIAWQSSGIGTQAKAGDALRTDSDAIAQLVLADQSGLTLQPNSVLRFRPNQAGGEPEFDLLQGDAFFQSGDKELPVRTTVGVATLRPGARLQLQRTGDALHILLHVGEATFHTTAGADVVLKRGETLKLEIGAAIIRESTGLKASLPAKRSGEGLSLEVPHGGVKARGPSESSYRALPNGTSAILAGTALSVAPGSRAILRRADDSVELFGAGDYKVTGEGPLVTTKRGKMHVQTKSGDILVVVPGGKILARAADGGSEANVEVGATSARLDVARGRVTWTSGDTEKQIAPGEPLEWSLPGDADEGTRPGGDTHTAQAHDPSDPQQRKPPEIVSFSVPAGESFVVHAPELPVALGIGAPSSCTGETLVELSNGGKYRGTGQVKVWLDAATRSYSVRCAEKPARTALRVAVRALEDAGTRKLPARPPTSNVEADGRGYTIYYQNQPPDIHVRWPNAPDTTAYQLDVDGNVLKLKAAEHTFVSGALADGQHRLTFSALSRRSRTTAVEVRFDNTAATASLNAPQDRGFSAGSEVEIEGVLLPAWKVSVDGGTIERVGESRFQGRIVTSPSAPDFAVRLSHRKLGTHYYVRRAAESQ
jgi:ferric-dicitrate binding protein FerR (iron transport regulator)